MGANIGSSVTNTLVSMGHITRKEEFKRALAEATVHDFFNVMCVIILLPVEMAFGYLEWLSQYVAAVFEGAGGMKFASPIMMAVTPAVDLLLDLMDNKGTLSLIVALVFMYLSLTILWTLFRF